MSDKDHDDKLPAKAGGCSNWAGIELVFAAPETTSLGAHLAEEQHP